jgi:hypothetical protein
MLLITARLRATEIDGVAITLRKGADDSTADSKARNCSMAWAG